MKHAVAIRTTLGLFAASLLAGACASTGAVPRPFPTPGGGTTAGAPPRDATEPTTDIAPRADSEDAPARAAAIDDYALVGTALALRGVPYRNGGSDPGGFDCSGFTQYVFAQYGVALPREVREQFEEGRSVKASDILAGDLLFFSTVAPGPSHVAIAIGGDQFVHAPSSTGVVRVERLSSSYWSDRYLGARRLEP
jgi:cell wall-associated NlpC family hydrolase